MDTMSVLKIVTWVYGKTLLWRLKHMGKTLRNDIFKGGSAIGAVKGKWPQTAKFPVFYCLTCYNFIVTPKCICADFFVTKYLTIKKKI